ncbi:T9SS type A sorting domain-containing protein [uncultured Winogradskyella sp.]|uniref:T9SS type A sorting domain-containing protein n=1 Tax=uncultured Winogradskyella sp. TaxID=395353 RepID=UPI002604A1D0|nr:T9SS type A sorting domain-containing protein [uncultured Winogradskyella sp.]
MKQIYLITISLLIILAANMFTYAQTIYYVDASKIDNSGDGLNWANAKKDLQPVLDIAILGDEIRVASGTYLPTESPDATSITTRDFAFHFNVNIVLKGSYIPDTDSDPSNDVQDYANSSILSGDMGSGTNTYHVLITHGLSTSSIIDGFTIKAGRANSTSSTGINYIGVSYLRFNGAGMYNVASSPSLINMIFSDNTASNGGAIYNDSSSPNFTNVVFYQNTALVGGGIYNKNANPDLTNITFFENFSAFGASGAGMYNDTSTPTLNNTVFYNNTNGTGTVSDIDGSTINSNSTNNASDGTGGGISITNPTTFVNLSAVAANTIFVDATNPAGSDGVFGSLDDGLIPANGSPLVDSGDNTQLPSGIITDITGQPRITGSTTDIGAYEYNNTLNAPEIDHKNNMVIFPNPLETVLHIKSQINITSAQVYSMSGQLLYSSTGANIKTLELNELTSGVYLLKVVQSNNKVTQSFRIIKQ